MVLSGFLIALSQRLLKQNKKVQQSSQILLLFIFDFIPSSLDPFYLHQTQFAASIV